MEDKRIMTKAQMTRYIEDIGRSELFEEMRTSRQYPRYLKAIRVSLIALGYNASWVEHEFRDALEKRYYRY